MNGPVGRSIHGFEGNKHEKATPVNGSNSRATESSRAWAERHDAKRRIWACPDGVYLLGSGQSRELPLHRVDLLDVATHVVVPASLPGRESEAATGISVARPGAA